MVLLNDEEELMKMFKFNDSYCLVYVSNTKHANGVILLSRYIKLNLELSRNCLFNL